MFLRLRGHLRSNVIGYLALFVALGGTSAYAANTISSGDIVDGEVRNADLAASAVTSQKINDGSVLNGELATNAVTSVKINNGSVLREDLAVDSVTSDQIHQAAVGPGEIAPNAVTATKVAPGAIGSAAIADFGIQGTDIASRSITADKLSAPDGWHFFGTAGNPGLKSGWVNYDAGTPSGALFAWPGYYVDHEGVVHLGGLVKGGTFGGANPIVTLPASLCPFYYRIFPVSSGNSIGRVTIGYVTAGGCNVNADAGSATYLSLDGIAFRQAAADTATSAATARAAG